jgi:hypothetical protein
MLHLWIEPLIWSENESVRELWAVAEPGVLKVQLRRDNTLVADLGFDYRVCRVKKFLCNSLNHILVQ